MRNIEAKILSATAVIGALWLTVDSRGNKPIIDPRVCIGTGRQVIPIDGELTQKARVVESLKNPNNRDCGTVETTLKDTQEGSVITAIISDPADGKQLYWEIGPDYYNPRREVVIAWTDGGQRVIATLDGLPAAPRRK